VAPRGPISMTQAIRTRRHDATPQALEHGVTGHAGIRVRVRDPPSPRLPIDMAMGTHGPPWATMGTLPGTTEEMDYIGTRSLPLDSIRIGQLFSSQSKYPSIHHLNSLHRL
jgi:hypothetical protein